jgi:hypothetical protein
MHTQAALPVFSSQDFKQVIYGCNTATAASFLVWSGTARKFALRSLDSFTASQPYPYATFALRDFFFRPGIFPPPRGAELSKAIYVHVCGRRQLLFFTSVSKKNILINSKLISSIEQSMFETQ